MTSTSAHSSSTSFNTATRTVPSIRGSSTPFRQAHHPRGETPSFWVRVAVTGSSSSPTSTGVGTTNIRAADGSLRTSSVALIGPSSTVQNTGMVSGYAICSQRQRQSTPEANVITGLSRTRPCFFAKITGCVLRRLEMLGVLGRGYCGAIMSVLRDLLPHHG